MENMLFGMLKSNPIFQKILTVVEALKTILPKMDFDIVEQEGSKFLAIICDPAEAWFIEWLNDMLPEEMNPQFYPSYAAKKAALLIPTREDVP